jgi:ABC-type lipoprotein release transport system permease subunit
MLLGVAVTLYFTHVGIGLGEAGELMTQYGISDRLYPRLSFLSLVAGPGIVLMITFIAALVPALKIPRLKPVDALVAV